MLNNSQIFGTDSNCPFLRLQDGTFIELAFGVRFETAYPKDFELALECSEFIADHFEAIRKGTSKFKVDANASLRIIEPEIFSKYGYESGEINYTYNGIEFSSRNTKGYVPKKYIKDWVETNHDCTNSELCSFGLEAFIKKHSIIICEIESKQYESEELFTCEKCNHTLSVSYSLKDPKCCFLCDESIPTSELLKWK